MKIGIDFDNTIINYGQLFHKYAINRFGMPPGTEPDKNAIRSYFWSLPEGNTLWTELQGIVYGEKILEANPAEGLFHFLSLCKKTEITVCIISHKSEYPALGPRINLRDAALEWLTANKFFDNALFTLPRSSVFFESTRTFKVMRIGTEKCTVFIDDLPEIFEDIHFPADVVKVLYSQEPCSTKDVIACEDWALIEDLIDKRTTKSK
jgi:hypothetical protein